MIIAKIAKENINKKTFLECDRLVKLLSEYYPDTSTFETSAIWADIMMNKGVNLGMKHGYAKIYDPYDVLDKIEFIKYSSQLEKTNCIKSIDEIVKALKNPLTNDLEKAIYLRYLIHLVGDLHEPLHCINYYSNEFKDGDRCGTKYLLNFSLSGKNSLHALWDSALLRDTIWVKVPLDEEGEKYLEDYKKEVIEDFPKSSFNEKDINLNFDLWANESYLIAVNHAYQNIKPNDIPSKDYIEENRKIAYRQIALASYRLANLLDDIFNK